MKYGRNAEPPPGIDPYTVEDEAAERAAFDSLPKQVRTALASARYEYSALQMLDVFKEIEKELTAQYFGAKVTPRQVWSAIVPMIEMNDTDAARKERHMLDVGLPNQFQADKRARIEAAFKRAS